MTGAQAGCRATIIPARPSGKDPRRAPSTATCVDEVKERVEGVRLDPRDPHHIPAGLLHATREERREVGAAGRQHQAVHSERLRAHLEPHVAEALSGPQPVDLGQEEAGVPIRDGADGAYRAPAALHHRGARHHGLPGAGSPLPYPGAAQAHAHCRPRRPAQPSRSACAEGGGRCRK